MDGDDRLAAWPSTPSQPPMFSLSSLPVSCPSIPSTWPNGPSSEYFVQDGQQIAALDSEFGSDCNRRQTWPHSQPAVYWATVHCHGFIIKSR
jgi:hypothetical protein